MSPLRSAPVLLACGHLPRQALVSAQSQAGEIGENGALMGEMNGHHRVYMSFQDRYGWHCQFLEADLKTSLPRHLHFTSADKIIELVERGGGFTDQESRIMLNQAIEKGRGGVFLNLTQEQYAKLKR
jgi:hypothetical protein